MCVHCLEDYLVKISYHFLACYKTVLCWIQKRRMFFCYFATLCWCWSLTWSSSAESCYASDWSLLWGRPEEGRERRPSLRSPPQSSSSASSSAWRRWRFSSENSSENYQRNFVHRRSSLRHRSSCPSQIHPHCCDSWDLPWWRTRTASSWSPPRTTYESHPRQGCSAALIVCVYNESKLTAVTAAHAGTTGIAVLSTDNLQMNHQTLNSPSLSLHYSDLRDCPAECQARHCWCQAGENCFSGLSPSPHGVSLSWPRSRDWPHYSCGGGPSSPTGPHWPASCCGLAVTTRKVRELPAFWIIFQRWEIQVRSRAEVRLVLAACLAVSVVVRCCPVDVHRTTESCWGV